MSDLKQRCFRSKCLLSLPPHIWILDLTIDENYFSEPEPKVQVYYCDHTLSAVRPSSLTFHIFDLNLLSNFWMELIPNSIQKFRFVYSFKEKKLLNGLERNLTGSKYSSSSPKFVFSGRSKIKMAALDLWLAEPFSTLSLQTLSWIVWNLTGSKYSASSTKFVLFEPIGRQRWSSLVSDGLRHCWLLPCQSFTGITIN